ncbi:MAG: hypothetical protein BAJATHORv1_50155 [Candidatus Thorarchaeota archaeon]|nr:MAG: hypothetical protein BAJATHORv1_50155 [Candidatus Thorarchaeota archaeon]
MKHKIVAAVLSLVIIILVGYQLIDFSAFVLGTPAGGTQPADLANAGQVLGVIRDWISSYRAIDVLIQATLLLAAVMGVSALVRSMYMEES